MSPKHISAKPFTAVLLPGLHGTAGLFHQMKQHKPARYTTLEINYPKGVIHSYEELTAMAKQQLLTIKGDFILVGESFSGPIAIMLGAQKLPSLKGVVLAASFIEAPRSKIWRYLPGRMMFYIGNSMIKITEKMMGRPDGMLKRMAMAIDGVKASVLTGRIQSVFSVDVKDKLKQMNAPLLYLRAERDLAVPSHNAKMIKAHKPSVQIIDIPANHLLLQTHAQEAWAAIQSFMNAPAQSQST
ncbi:alpha/beta fold hydrolase [Poriferisphaera sp. WC338]|uniref:alpha/beta fold hydrolase n=1 Tax=Poriferisphaera sp. WC338 TaxID=3425129 RepID=UPI003D81A9F2